MSNLDKALQSFLVESDESIAQLEQDIVALERQPDDAARLDSAFRAVHTIKGTCGFFGFNHLESLGHVIEDVLGAMRDGLRQMDLDSATVLLDGVDAMRLQLAAIHAQGDDGEAAPAALIERLRLLLVAAGQGQAAAAEPVTLPDAGSFPAELLVQVDSDVLPASEAVDGAQSQGKASVEKSADSAAVAEATVRVDVHLLDKLMNVVGELVLTRNQLLQYLAGQSDGQLANLAQRLNLVTSELQEGLMQTRMQPIRNAWATYPRLLLELERKTGKKVMLDMQGGDTELDRSLLEAIRDPLIHLVRNAVDHGIEHPQQRAATGKPEQGRLSLSAYHESGNVIVEISDDGAGLDSEAIIQRALAQGLVRSEQVALLTDQECLNFIFEPGFSTAATVSELSGRGVGLDVVRNNVERIGGSIDLHSQRGIGTTVKLKIPLTLAIVPALIVRCAHQRFAIPQVNLKEVVYVGGDNRAQQVESLHDVLVYRLRGRLLPLVDMRGLMQMAPRMEQQDQFIMVLSADQQDFGLLVDDVRDTEEIVVKPLGSLLKDHPCFAGATIMGDGRVALIVDVKATADVAGITRQERKLRAHDVLDEAAAQPQQSLESHLLVRLAGQRGQAALPLARISRLEEFAAEQIEYSAGRAVIQYRDGILPLIDRQQQLAQLGEEQETIKVVVYSSSQGEVGMVVSEIIDIVEDEKVALRKTAAQPGLLGAAIIQGRITDFIDCEALASLALATTDPVLNSSEGEHGY